MDSFDDGVAISGHSGSYGEGTNRFLRSLRSVEMTKATPPTGGGAKYGGGRDMRREYHPGFSGHFRLRGQIDVAEQTH